MKLKVVVHEAEEGGYWAEVPSIPGCATQGDSYEELLANVHEAVEGCLSVDVRNVAVSATDRIIETAAPPRLRSGSSPSRGTPPRGR